MQALECEVFMYFLLISVQPRDGAEGPPRGDHRGGRRGAPLAAPRHHVGRGRREDPDSRLPRQEGTLRDSGTQFNRNSLNFIFILKMA